MEDQPGPQIIQKHNPTYRTEPKEDQKFDPAAVKSVVDAIFLEQIEKKNLVWDEEECRELSLDLCDEIKEKVKALAFPRYKIIVQVSVGENKKQGVLVTSRCLWNTNTDNYVAYVFDLFDFTLYSVPLRDLSAPKGDNTISLVKLGIMWS